MIFINDVSDVNDVIFYLIFQRLPPFSLHELKRKSFLLGFLSSLDGFLVDLLTIFLF